MRRVYVAAAAALALTLTGCTDADPEAAPEPTPAASTSPSQTSAPPTPAGSATPSETSSAAGGTATPEPVAAPLDWQPTGKANAESVTTGGGWTIVVDEAGSLATVDGPHPTTVSGSKRYRVGDVLMSSAYAVIVSTDTLETDPAKATVIDLATGRKTKVDAKADLPPAPGGSWALDGSTLLHPTLDRGAYCLAQRDLAGGTATQVFCAEKRHGFNRVALTPAGVSLTSFDDARPSCRTVGSLADGTFTPYAGALACKGWDSLLTDAGPVWSDVPKDNEVDAAHFYASTADGVADLGPGTSSSLTWCGDAAYFVRDPQATGDPARLLRWTADQRLEVVYESPGGQAFLRAPHCGGDAITLAAYAESGDEQVTAPIS